MATVPPIKITVHVAERCYICDDPHGMFICLVFAANHDEAWRLLISKLRIGYQSYEHITPDMLEEIPMNGARLLRSSD